MRVHGTPVLAVCVETYEIVLVLSMKDARRLNSDDEAAPRLREAPRACQRDQVAERVQRVSIAPEARVLHRGEGRNDVESRRTPCLYQLSKVPWGDGRDAWVLGYNCSILESCHVGS